MSKSANKSWLNLGIVVFFIAFTILYTGIYVVDQRTVGIVKFLGNIQVDNSNKASIKEPGLHFKWPLLTKLELFDMRLMTLSSEQERIPTSDLKFVLVDYFLKWRINPHRVVDFYLSTTNSLMQVKQLLRAQVSNALKVEFGQKTIEDVISEKRDNVMQHLMRNLKLSAQKMGIDIIDVRIKTIALPSEVIKSVYRQMRTERERVANFYRYNGQSKAETLRAESDTEVASLIAAANRKALILKGKADAKASEIYANEYKKDPQFFDFYRSLQAYNTIFDKNKKNMLIVNPNDIDVFKHLLKKNSFIDQHNSENK